MLVLACHELHGSGPTPCLDLKPVENRNHSQYWALFGAMSGESRCRFMSEVDALALCMVTSQMSPSLVDKSCYFEEMKRAIERTREPRVRAYTESKPETHGRRAELAIY